MTFLDMLRTAERQNGSMLCVGLDPEPAKFPAGLRGDASKIYDFWFTYIVALITHFFDEALNINHFFFPHKIITNRAGICYYNQTVNQTDHFFFFSFFSYNSMY